MICILTQSFLEGTTEHVCAWLREWDHPHVRINLDDVESNGAVALSLSTRSSSFSVTVDDRTIPIETIRAVWYRRWRSWRSEHWDDLGPKRGQVLADPQNETRSNMLNLYQHVSSEVKIVTEYLFSRLQHASWLGRPENAVPNKLRVLETAASLGLDIPDTLVTSNRNQFSGFAGRHDSVITKPLSDPLNCKLDGERCATYTVEVPKTDILTERWEGGFPSLFQERLAKRYEIRTFYLDGESYSMAMFSQRFKETSVDFRHYSAPVRWVPYKLPADVHTRLVRLMQALKLETGSIDFVRTIDGRYVFLEVNPSGQFGMVSGPCNYHLEKRVAEALVKRDTTK